MKVSLSGGLCISNSLLEYFFSLVNVEPMQINCVAIDSPDSIVLAKDKIGGLLVILVS